MTGCYAEYARREHRIWHSAEYLTNQPGVNRDAKSKARELLERLPDDCSIEDVLYHLYVAQQVEAGLNDADAGRVTSHDLVVREMRRKWLLGAAG